VVFSDARRRGLDALRSDARVASALYEKRLIEMRAAAQALADEIATRALVGSDSVDRNAPAAWARLQDALPRAQNDAALDLVIVTDPLGRVIARQNDKPSPGETLLGADKSPVAERVIAGGNMPTATCVVERGDRYTRLGLDRVAPIRLDNGSTLNEALMIEAGAPIFSGGRFVGVVLIGQMLNTYYKPRPGSSSLQTPLVAEVKQTLSRGAEEDAGALIALDRAIVASSVPPDAARDASGRALAGTAHDPAKTEEESRDGERDYSIAWQPLKSLDGAAIGAIGYARPTRELEGPAAAVRTTMLLTGAVAAIAAGVAGFMFGRGLGARLDVLRQAANRWSLGELSASAREREPVLSRWVPPELLRDEINDLAEQLDRMRESFRQAIERMRKR
jgi:HAMP domain-containing protein